MPSFLKSTAKPAPRKLKANSTNSDLGQYFTPPDLARFMLSLTSVSTSAKVLEPCAGEGVFVQALSKAGFRHITAYEIDPALIKRNTKIKKQDFLEVPLEPQEFTYDLIIGNPPYVKWRHIPKAEQELLEADPLWSKYCNHYCDYSFAFILKAIAHLKPGGELIFIVSDYWLNNMHAQGMRRYMAEHGYLKQIFTFQENDIFEDVNTSVVIFHYVKFGVKQNSESKESESQLEEDVTNSNTSNSSNNLNKSNPLDRKSNLDSSNQAYKQNKALNYNPILTPQDAKEIPLLVHTFPKRWVKLPEGLQLSHFTTEAITQFTADGLWRLISKKTQSELDRLKKACTPKNGLITTLGDVLDIGSGMVSGHDATFNFTDYDLPPQEQEALIRVIKSKDLVRYGYTKEARYFFLQEKLTQAKFQAKFPTAWKRFEAHKTELEGRYDYGQELKLWEFAFPRSQKLFKRPKPRLLVPCKERITARNYIRFCVAPSYIMPVQDIVALVPNDDCREDIWYILAWLSSHMVFTWIKNAGVVKGGVVVFAEKPLSTIPYRAINFDDPREVQLYERIIVLARQASALTSNKAREEISLELEELFKALTAL